jgi:hypothetical protein
MAGPVLDPMSLKNGQPDDGRVRARIAAFAGI